MNVQCCWCCDFRKVKTVINFINTRDEVTQTMCLNLLYSARNIDSSLGHLQASLLNLTIQKCWSWVFNMCRDLFFVYIVFVYLWWFLVVLFSWCFPFFLFGVVTTIHLFSCYFSVLVWYLIVIPLRLMSVILLAVFGRVCKITKSNY